MWVIANELCAAVSSQRKHVGEVQIDTLQAFGIQHWSQGLKRQRFSFLLAPGHCTRCGSGLVSWESVRSCHGQLVSSAAFSAQAFCWEQKSGCAKFLRAKYYKSKFSGRGCSCNLGNWAYSYTISMPPWPRFSKLTKKGRKIACVNICNPAQGFIHGHGNSSNQPLPLAVAVMTMLCLFKVYPGKQGSGQTRHSSQAPASWFLIQQSFKTPVSR